MGQSDRRTDRARRTRFEPLEERLVLAPLVGLRPTSAPDIVTLSPGPTSATAYDLALGPAIVGNFDPSQLATFAGQSLYQTAGAGMTVQGDSFIAVEAGKSYALNGWAKSGDEFGQRFRPSNVQAFGIAYYDANYQPKLGPGGGTGSLIALNSQAVPDDWTWTQYSGLFGAGQPNALPEGTAFIKPVIVANLHGATDNFISWRDVSVTEVAATTTLADLKLPTIDLSTVDGSDKRHALPLPQGTPLSWSMSLVKVDTTKLYVLSGRAKNLSEYDERPVGFASLDIDRKLIHPLHVTKHGSAADTTLAAALVPGATSILVTNATGWSNAAWESAGTRSLAWYGYADSTGHVYPDYGYTRNVAFDFDQGLWEPGGVQFDGAANAYRIQLRKPWTGPTLAAGAAVRNAASGEALQQPAVTPAYDAFRPWTEYSAMFGGGQWQSGQRDDGKFRPGTAYIQPVFDGRAAWTDAAIRPQQNTVPKTSVFSDANHRIELDLDVLGKGALNFAQPLLGDYDQSGLIDAGDYVAWRNSFGVGGIPPFTGADGNGDGQVDNADLAVWRAGFGRTSRVVIDSVAAKHGTVSIVPGVGTGGRAVVRYQSAAWFVGTDVVSYVLRNTDTGATFRSTIDLNLLGGNHGQNASLATTIQNQGLVTNGNVAPTARDDEAGYVTLSGRALEADGGRAPGVLANDSDPTDVLVARLVSGPTHGTLSLKYDGTFVYTPAAGFVGIDTFRYETYDGRHTATAVASITVQATPDDLVLRQLQDIALAMHNYAAVLQRFPLTGAVASHFDANGNPFLSWRVHILPYLGYESLYNEFRLNEPWNSAHNLPLAAKMPAVFGDPRAVLGSTTRLQIVSGEGAPYYWRRSNGLLIGPTFSNFTDGPENTLLVVESGANKAVTWTKPEDLVFDPVNPLAALGTIAGNRIPAVTANAEPITLPASISPATLTSLVTISGGETIDAATLRRQFAQTLGGPAAATSYAALNAANYFRMIAIAMHNYLDVKKSFPVSGASNFDANGNPYLSWRVHILPYIGQTSLYNQFHLNEPWNSPHNLALVAYMPDVFRSVGDAASSTTTRVMTFTGPQAPFGFRTPGTNQTGPTTGNFTDGMTNTILFLEAGGDKAVTWTMPVDIALDVNNPFAALGQLTSGEMRVAFADASIASLPSDLLQATLTGLATRAGTTTTAAYDTEELRDAQTIAGRELSRRGRFDSAQKTANNLKSIALAMHNHHDATTRFPSSIVSTAGAPLLSWRVRLLPYMGYTGLYNQFNRSEPWDSPHNLALLKYMPDVFRGVGDPWDAVTTRVMTFTGAGAPFDVNSGTGPRANQITDGTSRTIMFVEAGDGVAVPWTKPADMPFLSNPYESMGQLGPNFLAAFFDASVRTQLSSMPAADLHALVTHNGGEPAASSGLLAGTVDMRSPVADSLPRGVAQPRYGSAGLPLEDAANRAFGAADSAVAVTVSESFRHDALLLAWLAIHDTAEGAATSFEAPWLDAAETGASSSAIAASIDEVLRLAFAW